jgi:hypothetical protein
VRHGKTVALHAEIGTIVFQRDQHSCEDSRRDETEPPSTDRRASLGRVAMCR